MTHSSAKSAQMDRVLQWNRIHSRIIPHTKDQQSSTKMSEKLRGERKAVSTIVCHHNNWINV